MFGQESIFSYTGSPQVKISQKVLGRATFLTHTVHRSTCGQLSQTGRRCSQSGSQQQGDQDLCVLSGGY